MGASVSQEVAFFTVCIGPGPASGSVMIQRKSDLLASAAQWSSSVHPSAQRLGAAAQLFAEKSVVGSVLVTPRAVIFCMVSADAHTELDVVVQGRFDVDGYTPRE